MAKLQSTLTNMLLSLTSISVVAAALLALVYTQTKDPIAASEKKAKTEAKLAVLPGFEGQVVIADSARVVEDVKIYDATINGAPCGAAVEVHETGFGGDFSLMVGFNLDGQILGYKVLNHQETPGLGSKMQEWFSDSKRGGSYVIGRVPGEAGLTVSKDNGQVDAITAATISSRAFLKAINKAYNAYFAAGNACSEKQCCQDHACCQEKAEGCCGHCCQEKAEGCCQHECEHQCCHEAAEDCCQAKENMNL